MPQAEATTLDVRRVPAESVDPNPWNPNVVEADVQAAIQQSVEHYGFIDPILARPRARGRYEVIDGEHRLEAARQLGHSHVEVIVRDLSDADAQKLTAIMIEARGKADPYKLGALLHGLRGAGLDEDALKLGLPFDSDALERLVALGTPASSDPEPPPPADPPAEPETRPGDVLELGRHRLVCGDSTDEATWAALLGGERPGLVVTDPPYGVGWNAGGVTTARPENRRTHLGVMAGDRDGREAALLWSRWLEVAAEFTAPDACAYTFGPINDLEAVVLVGNAIVGSPWRAVVPIVWDRGYMGLGRFQGWRHRVEWAWELQRGVGAPWLPPDAADNLLSGHQSGPYAAIRDPAAYEHPTPKPVTLMEALVRSRRSEVVVDPFGGSGATLLACERAGRAARLIEIDPGYCDLIRRRWAQVQS